MNIFFVLVLLLVATTGNALNVIVKVGNAITDDNPAFTQEKFDSNWKDGQILEIQDDHKYIGTATRKGFAIFHIQGKMSDFPELSRAYISEADKKNTIRKYWSPGNGRKRDYFINFEELIKLGVMSQSDWNRVLDKNQEMVIEVPYSLSFIAQHFKLEGVGTRDKKAKKRKGTIDAAGTYTIGTAKTYADIGAFEADLPADLTSPSVGGVVIGEFQVSEATDSNGGDLAFGQTTDSTDKIKITVHADNRHSGVYSTSKARIVYGTYDSLSTGGSDDMEFEYLQIDNTGSNNDGLYITGSGGTSSVHHCIFKGDINNTDDSLNINNNSGGTVYAYNNIIYGAGQTALYLQTQYGGDAYTAYIYNNTVDISANGITFNNAASPGTYTAKNNIVQGCTTDWIVLGLDTSGTNISEDATSPDVAYRSIDLHNATSNFNNYGANDYTLVEGSEESTLDDGEDLSGTFADDIAGTTRVDWYIGAFELEAAAAATPAVGYPQIIICE